MSDEITIKQTGDRARNLGDHAMLVVGLSSDKKTFIPLSFNENGELVISGGGAVTVADGDDEALGAKADTAAADDTGSASLIALQKRGLTHLSTLLAYQFGLGGSDTVTDGDLEDVVYYAVKAITNVTITAVTFGAGHTGAAEWAGKTIFAGDTVHVAITDIEFTGTAQFFKVPA